MAVAPVDPYRHFIFPKFPVPLLKNYAERIEIPFDLNEVLFADARPLCLERCLELLPELSELFLIHMNSLVRCEASTPLGKDTSGALAESQLWRSGVEAAETGESDAQERDENERREGWDSQRSSIRHMRSLQVQLRFCQWHFFNAGISLSEVSLESLIRPVSLVTTLGSCTQPVG